MYYDFSSNQGGDIFTFVQTMEGLDFKGALQMLAERAGVELRQETRQTKNARDRMYAVLDDASRFYETKFAEHADARAYLQSRGLEPATMRSFRVGFAPDDWRTLHDYLTHKGYSAQELERAGLVKRGDKGSYYDRFRSRIMFPIFDTAGRVVAFSGRIFGEAAKDDKNAKYLNSPETELFDKGRILYGYDKAKQFIRKYDFSILVEGQMDIVMSHQAGYNNTVAVSGTGLTEHHLALLDRLSKKLVLAFDADAAGVASTGRAAALALARGMDVKVARVPVGKDPADCIKENVGLWKEAVRDASHVVEFFLARALAEPATDERKRSLLVRDTVLPYVARIQSGVDQAHFVRVVSAAIGLAEDAVWQDVRAHARVIARENEYREPTREPVAQKPHEQAQRTRTEELERELAGFLYWQDGLETRAITDDDVREQATALGLQIAGIVARYSEERDMLAMRAEVLHENTPRPETVLTTLLTALALEQLQDERRDITRRLKEAESIRDTDKIDQLLLRFKELSQRIEKLDVRS
jgi:DNA primase